MAYIFWKLLNMGLSASWLILAVLIFRLILRRAPKWILCLLWALVAVKLVCPYSVESAFSLIPSSEPLPEQIMTENSFYVNTGLEMVDAPINGYLGDHYYEGVSVPADNGNRVMGLLGAIWATGFLLLLTYSLISYYRLCRVTRISIPVGPGIFRCGRIDTPFVLGMVKPRIYLPSCMEEAQTEYVIAHERAHLRRKDHWWKPMGFLFLAIYWFQPLCWVSYILFCRDIELACDEKVIQTLGGENKKRYAQALLSCSIRQSAVTACPLAFGEAGVKERVKNVLHYKKPALWMILAAFLCCIITAVCFWTSPEEEAPSAATEPAGDEEMKIGRQEILSDTLARWQMIFCARDAEAIADMVTPELAGEMLMGSEGSYSFGVSSPWPWDEETCSYLYDYDEETAVLYYYAMTSDPHVTCWKEVLEYHWKNDRYVITGENLICYDSISTGAEFEDAYPLLIDGTMMDYTRNGLGETLNENALLSSSMVYRELFEPESAAAFLLNLSKDPEKVRCTLQQSEQSGTAELEITFLSDRRSFAVSMRQPYGDPGIWVPVN